ncbi:SDR family oxidoreductase [Salarchaeum sp. JOR-1]|uniref:SDR family oxidoreductase n=1 Tax=Salarchaeum sp. JOR-1 TaxID=2599399 RepID=UPI001198C44E|nr:SDR family oxidoreductase [Salarchaeum sp. JOR-1]QDX41493.1 SDR family oxidoreductase [Salarchaeum sp. JOR-1]
MGQKPPLDGRTAIVTGASAGIGRATAHALAADGANVALAARRTNRLETIADALETEYGADTLVAPTDVTDEADVDALVADTVEHFGGLDVLVNNAGLARGDGDVPDMDTDAYETMMAVNCDGMFYATRAALPHLVDTQGNLVFVGSFAGQYPRPGNPVYAATKWWTRGFAHSVEAQYGDQGVGVTVVNPTEVRTEFGSELGESFEERFDEGEVTAPAEIADAIAFAARQERSTASEIDLYRRDKFSDW